MSGGRRPIGARVRQARRGGQAESGASPSAKPELTVPKGRDTQAAVDQAAADLIAALDGSATGDIKTTKWAVKGTEFAFSSPLIDGPRVYQIDGGSTMHAYDLASGKQLWTLALSTAQKAPPVMADGKIYVGTDGGKFFVVRPGADKGEILSAVTLPNSVASCCGSEGTAEQVLAGHKAA